MPSATDSSESHQGNTARSACGDDPTKKHPETFLENPFKPFEDALQQPSDGSRILSLRAILLGCLCGTLVNASNIYLGLKTGWTSSANILGAIVGFSVLKRLSPKQHSFGIHENNIVQTVATASGGMSNVFISAIPALYQLNLLTTPPQDLLRIICLTAVGGYFGLLSIVPLRKFFIRDVAQELNLIFPSSSATAMTIRSMHLAAGGAEEAQVKMKTILFAFAVALVLRVLSQYAVGIIWDWHIFTWMHTLGILTPLTISAESWGWFVEWSPAMMGSGSLVGSNVAFSFLGGSVIAWAIIGPYIVSQGVAFGEAVHSDTHSDWNGLMSYISMSDDFTSAEHPSARYWLLWPGVACMLAVAFTELICQYRVFWVLIRSGGCSLWSMFSNLIKSSDYQYAIVDGGSTVPEDQVDAPGSGNEGIQTWMWAPGLAVITILGCIVMKLQLGMTVAETLLSLALAFSLSLIAIQATGATDVTPLTAVSKVSQVVLSPTTHVSGREAVEASQRLNLLGGALTNIGANQACDLIGDFRVGYLLQTPPRLQYAAQLLGTIVATFIAPAVFVLFTTAYPCILDSGAAEHTAGGTSNQTNSTATCEFSGPSIAAWRAVAVAVTGGGDVIPASSLICCIVMAVLGSVAVLIRQILWTGKLAFMRAYHPNMMIFALAFTMPSPQYGLAMTMGALLARVWRCRRPDGFEKYAFAAAAGLIAGEGVGGSINGVLTIIGLGGRRWGTTWGCPDGRC